MPDYFNLYLEKSKEHNFTPAAVQEIIRYLMVNGIIPVTEEHLALMGDKEFHVSAKHVPEKYRKEAEAQYLAAPTDGRYIEEHEIEWLDTKEHELDGVWFKNGKMEGFRMEVTRIVKVTTSFDYPPEGEDAPEVIPWKNRICSECKSEYYANCPYDGKPQPHCDDPRMKKETAK